jgi:hypothetical protein
LARQEWRHNHLYQNDITSYKRTLRPRETHQPNREEGQLKWASWKIQCKVTLSYTEITANKYVPIATFVLPDNCWTDHFFAPQVPAQAEFLLKHAGNKTAEEFVKYAQHEAVLYSKYKDFYGYVFFIGKKI